MPVDRFCHAIARFGATHTQDADLFLMKLNQVTAAEASEFALAEEAEGNAAFFSQFGSSQATYSFKEAAAAKAAITDEDEEPA